MSDTRLGVELCSPKTAIPINTVINRPQSINQSRIRAPLINSLKANSHHQDTPIKGNVVEAAASPPFQNTRPGVTDRA